MSCLCNLEGPQLSTPRRMTGWKSCHWKDRSAMRQSSSLLPCLTLLAMTSSLMMGQLCLVSLYVHCIYCQCPSPNSLLQMPLPSSLLISGGMHFHRANLFFNITFYVSHILHTVQPVHHLRILCHPLERFKQFQPVQIHFVSHIIESVLCLLSQFLLLLHCTVCRQ